jgi:1-acyl-sn-glycerol-3-phosphate acyltransferase
MPIIAKLRLGAHLLRGVFIVATRFSRAPAEVRHELNRAWSLELLRLCGMKLVVHNDQARLERGALVVGNHISWIDIYVVNAWRPTPFVSKAEVRHWPVIGWFARNLDTVFLEREKRSDARRIMHELAQRLESGELMCLFPEGTTSSGANLLPFHANLFQAAVLAACPVQPICIMYEDAHGQSLAPAYIDDLTLGQTLDAILHGAPLTAHLYVCEPLAAGPDRRGLARAAQASIETALRSMQAVAGSATESVAVPHDDAAALSRTLE